MHHQLTCTCGAQHAVSTRQAGGQIQCVCGALLAIPTLRGIRELPLVDTPGNRVASEKDQPTQRRRSAIIGLMFAIFFLSVPAAIFFGYQRWTMDTSFTRERDLQEAFNAIDQTSAIEISEAWNEFSTGPLGPPEKPDFFHIQQRAQQLNLRIALACGIACLAAILAAILSLSGRTSQTNSTGKVG